MAYLFRVGAEGLIRHPQFFIRNHNVFAIGGAVGEGFVVTPEVRAIGAIDVDIEIAIQTMAELDVGKGEMIVSEITLAGEVGLGNIEKFAELAQRVVDRSRVAARRRGAEGTPKNRNGKVRGDIYLRPFRPAVDVGAGIRIFWPKRV